MDIGRLEDGPTRWDVQNVNEQQTSSNAHWKC